MIRAEKRRKIFEEEKSPACRINTHLNSEEAATSLK